MKNQPAKPKKNIHRASVAKQLLREMGKSRFAMIGALSCAVISSILSLYGTRLTGRGIDFMLGQGRVDFQNLGRIVLVMAGCFLCSASAYWLMNVLANRIAFQTASTLRAKAFKKLMRLPMYYFDTHSHGDVISRLSNDIDSISDGLLQVINKLFSGVVLLVGSLWFMFGINPIVALLVILLTPLSLWLSSVIAKRSAHSFREQSRLVGRLNGYAEEILAAENLVMLYGQEKTVEKQFDEIDGELYQHGFRAQYYTALVNPVSRLVNHVIYVLVGALGGWFILSRGAMTVGDLSSLLMYATQFAKPINEITSVATQIQAAMASAGRIFELLDEVEEQRDLDEAIQIQQAEGTVRFDRVFFSYQPDTKLIQNLSLYAQAGSTIAIVGPTGAGKTTLVNLLMRFYEVDHGTIFLDDHDIQGVTRDSLRRNFGMVLQESWIFQGSVRDNIAYGHPDATEEDVKKAAKMAYAHNFIRRLPKGYDTIIDMESGLSQGQMQLLTLARAMLTDPPMLILDEATSSIDTRTEQYIQKALLEMMKGRTSFVIAHRLSTIRNADLILVMRNGNIVEQGTHQELIAKKSFYRELHDSQFSS